MMCRGLVSGDMLWRYLHLRQTRDLFNLKLHVDHLRSLSYLHQTSRRMLQPLERHWRFFSSTGDSSSSGRDKGSDKPTQDVEKEDRVPSLPSEDEMEEEEDEFGTIGFGVSAEDEARERARIEAELAGLENSTDDLTPQIASDLVKRMVAAASTGPVGKVAKGAEKGSVLTRITRNSIRVLGAMRIETNQVVCAGTQFGTWPIARKVVGWIHVDKLGLSELAEVALEKLAASRWNDRKIKLVCQKYGTSEENQAHTLWMAERLVAEAQVAVGEEVNETPIEGWNDIMKSVEQYIEKEPDSQGLVDGIRIRANECLSVP